MERLIHDIDMEHLEWEHEIGMLTMSIRNMARLPNHFTNSLKEISENTSCNM